MPTKYNLIAGIGLFCLSLPTMSAENRCGWIENPGPGTWWLTDKDAIWEISTQGGYSVTPESIDNLPNVIPNEYVRVSGIYGYSCGCIVVDTDRDKRRIMAIRKKGKQVLLKKCLEDKSIASRRQPVVKPMLVPENPVSKPTRQSVRPVTTTQSSTGYFIQVITTSDKNKANTLKNSFAKDGFDTIVTSVRSNGKFLYRVNFGPFASQSLAAQAQATLKGIFAGNANVQESILVSAKSAASQRASTSTQCFSKRLGKELTGIQLSITGNQVNGYYAWEPYEKDGARGFLQGTLKGNQIIASHMYMVEGYVGSEEVAYRLVKGGLIAGNGGRQVSNGADSTRFKDVAAINWSKPERYQTVDCQSIHGAINNAMNVHKEILKQGRP